MQRAYEPIADVDYITTEWSKSLPKKCYDYVGFFDLETCMNENGVHEAYQLAYWIGEADVVPAGVEKIACFSGFDCVTKFRDHIKEHLKGKKVLLFAHNAGFDFSFILKEFNV